VERATVRTTWTPWAASARLCLGRRWTGWELPAHATTCPRPAMAHLHPSAGRSPAGGTGSDRGLDRAVLAIHGPASFHSWARVGAVRAGAGRRQERHPQRSRERARRSGAQPGFDRVGIVLRGSRSDGFQERRDVTAEPPCELRRCANRAGIPACWPTDGPQSHSYAAEICSPRTFPRDPDDGGTTASLGTDRLHV